MKNVGERILLSPDEAISLLPDGEYVHNFIANGILFGCDYTRQDAICALKDANEIEIAGTAAHGMKHPIAVFNRSGKLSFFEADMNKLAKFEAENQIEAGE